MQAPRCPSPWVREPIVWLQAQCRRPAAPVPGSVSLQFGCRRNAGAPLPQSLGAWAYSLAAGAMRAPRWPSPWVREPTVWLQAQCRRPASPVPGCVSLQFGCRRNAGAPMPQSLGAWAYSLAAGAMQAPHCPSPWEREPTVWLQVQCRRPAAPVPQLGTQKLTKDPHSTGVAYAADVGGAVKAAKPKPNRSIFIMLGCQYGNQYDDINGKYLEFDNIFIKENRLSEYSYFYICIFHF